MFEAPHIYFSFKEAVPQDFLFFFISWIKPIWVPDKHSKMVSLKNSYSRKYSRKTWLRAVWYCLESDFAQYHTARSWEIEISKMVSHCAESTIKIYRRSKMVSHCAESDSAQCDTARSFAGNNFIFAGFSLPSMRIINFYKNICALLQHSPTFLVNILKG